MHPADASIAQVAGRQDNVISRAQLIALGVGRRTIARQLERGRWQRLHRGIYLIGPAPPTLRAKTRAAALSCGEGSIVSHRSAAAIYGLMPPAGDVHITVPGRNPGNRDGVRTHRVTTLSFIDAVIRDGLRLTSPARTICDVAGTEPPGVTERALTEAQVQRLVTTQAIEAVIERTPTLKGSSVIRALLRAGVESGYTRSEAERRMRRLAAAAGLDQPQLNVPVLGYVVDFLWPAQRLVVEVDGYQFHGHRQKFESDRRRDQQLVAAGYRVIRVTWLQLRDEPIAVIASVAQALALAAAATA